MSQTSLAYAAITLTTITWASSLIFAKLIFDEVGPIVFVALRYTLACPFLLILTLQWRKNHDRDDVRKNWKILLVAGICGPFISQVLQYIGLELTTASDALLLLNLTPIFAVLIAAPLLKEAITLDKILGLVLATIGATFIVMTTSPEYSAINVQRILGDIIVIVSTLFFALNGIAGKIAIGTESAIAVTFYSSLFAVPFIWVSAIFFEDVTVLLTMSGLAWLVIFWVAIINTVVAFILYYESMKHIEASRVQIILNLIAVWGVMMSVFILGETVTILQIFGGFLTVVGVILAQLAQVKRKPNEVLITSK
ncbi:MAG: DMT family transporter [Candidatus Thorarchaeota archaeon]|nr:DMT family transporter [Candidatus Thorarchaeota archaeon]